jgi:ABC-2 type transport system ATP-binding protein
MTAAIEVRALRKSFGKKRGLVDLSLHVTAGEIFGLVGPDGAGKTTALRIMAGLLDPGAGSVRLLDQDPFDPRTTVREALGYMPQQYSLYGDLSVAENLAFFREMYGLSPDAFRARRDRLLAVTRLAEFKARRVEALSGGMYKKLALACALLHEPKVLLLDEPTNGVDPVSRREFWDLLGEFLADGMAIVIATPYMDEAARCHRVGLLDEGRLLQEGAPDDMLRAFSHPVFALRGDRDRLEAAIEHDDDVLAFTVAGDHLRIVIRQGHDERVLAEVRSAGAQVAPALATFEDVFLTCVREAPQRLA